MNAEPGPMRPALDAAVVDGLVRLGAEAGQDLMGQITDLFVGDAATRMIGLRAALAHGDATTLALSAHALRGASANLGADELARLSATLELQSSARKLVDAEAQLDALEAEVGRVCAALLERRGTA